MVGQSDIHWVLTMACLLVDHSVEAKADSRVEMMDNWMDDCWVVHLATLMEYSMGTVMELPMVQESVDH